MSECEACLCVCQVRDQMRMRARNNTDVDDGDDDDHCLREVYANVGALIRVRRRHRAASVVGAYSCVVY